MAHVTVPVECEVHAPSSNVCLVCSSAVDFRLVWQVICATDVVTAALGQPQTAYSNSSYAIIAVLCFTAISAQQTGNMNKSL